MLWNIGVFFLEHFCIEPGEAHALIFLLAGRSSNLRRVADGAGKNVPIFGMEPGKIFAVLRFADFSHLLLVSRGISALTVKSLFQQLHQTGTLISRKTIVLPDFGSAGGVSRPAPFEKPRP
jgi:hypothetical protein